MTTVYIPSILLQDQFIDYGIDWDNQIIGVYTNEQKAFDALINYLVTKHHSKFLNILVLEDDPRYNQYVDDYSEEFNRLFKSSITNNKQLYEYCMYHSEYFQVQWCYYIEKSIMHDD